MIGSVFDANPSPP